MFHKEGYTIIIVAFAICLGVIFMAEYGIVTEGWKWLVQVTALVVLTLVLQFFRNPVRHTGHNDKHVVGPADGRVVIVQEVFEKEYFKDQRIQISIFMSPLNVHVNRYPIGGKVVFSKYHAGKYLVAWHPKSSEKNERTTVVVDNLVFGPVLYRQIAGAMARRIVCYAKKDMEVEQGADSGFIKFGSRVDVFLPMDAEITVTVGDMVKGGIDVIARKG